MKAFHGYDRLCAPPKYGQRAIKYAVKQGGSGERTETLYYNKWYQLVSTNDNLRMVESKHIYVGETRIATKQRHDDNSNYSEELKHTYYYHGDHLGSAQVVTNGVGEIYEHIEYTPYGELWVDHTKRIGGEEGTPFRFTGKEYDEETGLYYYGARYLDPKTSRWISTDPAMGEYIPGAPINDEAKKHNQNLPGMGGVFNYVNLHVYHYAGNNPIKLVDPDGRDHRIGFGSDPYMQKIMKRFERERLYKQRVEMPNKLDSIFYYNGKNRLPIITTPNSTSKDNSILLKRKPITVAGASLPVMPKIEDLAKSKESTLSGAMGGVGFANEMLKNITDENGNMSGDIILAFTTSGGLFSKRVTEWSIVEVTKNIYTGVWSYETYTKDEALKFIKENRFSDAKINEIYKKLNLD